MPEPSVSGSDGHAPIYNADGRYQTWALDQIWRGPSLPGQNKYVPNVDDDVIDRASRQKYRVTSVNPTTLEPTLVVIQEPNITEFSQRDILLGVGPGTPSDTYRAYLDKSVTPYRLTLDQRLYFYGTMTDSVKIFKGSQVEGNRAVISARYDNSNNLIGNSVPVVLAGIREEDGQNYSVWAVPTCYTTADLPDNEILTVVAYDDAGGVVSQRQVLVQNTRWIRSMDASLKHIVGISLKSPFLSQSDPLLLQVPMNVNQQGMNMIGVVHYSDGSTAEHPVDGNKFELFGFGTFISTIPGQGFPITLKYNVANGEYNYIAGQGGALHISENYRVVTTDADGKYTPKLVCYPEWISSVQGYSLKWFMTTLERDVVYDVTQHVTINTNTAAFNPTAYGVQQNLSVSVNLHDVNGSFRNYVHTQTVTVVLAAQGTARQTNWTIGFEPNQDPRYGNNVHAATVFIDQDNSTVNIGLGLDADEQPEWLERLYKQTKPIRDPSRETAAPLPTHFALKLSGGDAEFPISQWRDTITLSTSLANNSTLFVRFFKRVGSDDLQLTVAGLPVWQQV